MYVDNVHVCVSITFYSSSPCYCSLAMEFTSIVPAVGVKLCVNCLFEWQGCFCHYAPPNPFVNLYSRELCNRICMWFLGTIGNAGQRYDTVYK